MSSRLGLFLLATMVAAGTLTAQGPRDYTVALRASHDAASKAVTVSWPQSADAVQYEVYRKGISVTDFPPTPLAVLDSTSTAYSDAGCEEGTGYEYRVLRLSRRQVGKDSVTGAPVYAQWIATGYVFGGSKVVPTDRGRVLLVIDSTLQQALVRSAASPSSPQLRGHS